MSNRVVSVVLIPVACLAVAPVGARAQQPAGGPVAAAAQSAAAAAAREEPRAAETSPRAGATWEFKDAPTLRVGDAFRIDFKAAVQGDFLSYDPTPDSATDTEELGLLRVGVEGTVAKIVDYEVKYEFQDDEDPWKDVYANVRIDNAFQVRGGRFKIPYGRERLQGVTSLDFFARTLVSQDLTPGRDTGVAVHGRTKRSGLAYEAGYFWGTPEGGISRIKTPDYEGPEEPNLDPFGPIGGGRVVVRPFRLADRRGWFEDLEAAFDIVGGELDEGLFGARGRSLFGPEYFPRVYVKGPALGLGVDGGLRSGPFSVQAEYLRVTEARENQGLGDETLPDLLGQGWWVAGTWVVTGQYKSRADDPRAWFPGRGIGAVELALRYDTLEFKSVSTGGEEPDRNPRATNIYPNADSAWTAGVNWYLNRFVKLQLNAIREHFDDLERTPLAGQDTFWTYALKLQVAM